MRFDELGAGFVAIEGTDRVYLCPIVGESHYQDALEDLCGGRHDDSAEQLVSATLLLEDSNPYDDHAVRVDIDGRTVGYLSRSFARTFRKALPPTVKRAQVSAVIRGGRDRGDGERGNFGVWLDLPLDELAG